MPDQALTAWFQANERNVEDEETRPESHRRAIAQGQSGLASNTKSLPQVIHAVRTVDGVQTVEHAELTVGNWHAWIKDPVYTRMRTHPEGRCDREIG